jgi:amino acid transporter
MSSNETGSKKGMSMSSCIRIAVGGMVGSAIFTLSGVTYGMAGSAAIITWILAGIVVLLYALNISELATTFPRMGGIFVFPQQVLGKKKWQKDFAGWFTGWAWLFGDILGIAFSAIMITTYLEAIIPAIKDSPTIKILIPIIWIAGSCLFNILGLSTMGKVNTLLISLLLLVCGTYIVVGLGHFDTSNFFPFVGGTMGGFGVLAGVPTAMLGFGSIIGIASISSEIREPKKTIPKVMCLSILITVILYSLILLTTFGMAPVSDFIQDPGRQYWPVAYALAKGLNGTMSWMLPLIPVAVVLAISNLLLILNMDSGRTLYAIAESGYMPKMFAKKDKKSNTPVNALIAVAVISAIFTLVPSLLFAIIGTGAICTATTATIIAVSVIVLRKKKELQVEGTFKVPGGILIPVITIIIIALTLVYQFKSPHGAMSFVLGGAWFAIGIIIFFVKCMFVKKSTTTISEQVHK